MCSRLYDDPHWAAMAKRGLGPANNAYYKEYHYTSPGGLGPMFISSNEYDYISMRHGHNYSLPYKGGLQHFSPLIDKSGVDFSKLGDQVSNYTRITYNPHACQWGAVTQVYSDIKDSEGHTPHPHGISYETGAPIGMARIPPYGSGSYDERY